MQEECVLSWPWVVVWVTLFVCIAAVAIFGDRG